MDLVKAFGDNFMSSCYTTLWRSTFKGVRSRHRISGVIFVMINIFKSFIIACFTGFLSRHHSSTAIFIFCTEVLLAFLSLILVGVAPYQNTSDNNMFWCLSLHMILVLIPNLIIRFQNYPNSVDYYLLYTNLIFFSIIILSLSISTLRSLYSLIKQLVAIISTYRKYKAEEANRLNNTSSAAASTKERDSSHRLQMMSQEDSLPRLSVHDRGIGQSQQESLELSRIGGLDEVPRIQRFESIENDKIDIPDENALPNKVDKKSWMESATPSITIASEQLGDSRMQAPSSSLSYLIPLRKKPVVNNSPKDENKVDDDQFKRVSMRPKLSLKKPRGDAHIPTKPK